MLTDKAVFCWRMQSGGEVYYDLQIVQSSDSPAIVLRPCKGRQECQEKANRKEQPTFHRVPPWMGYSVAWNRRRQGRSGASFGGHMSMIVGRQIARPAKQHSRN